MTYAKYKGDRATDPAAEYAVSKEDFPPFGTVVACGMDGTTNTQYFDHGLKRIPQGGLVLSQEDNVSIAFLSADTVESLGKDPAETMALIPGGTSQGAVRMWVF